MLKWSQSFSVKSFYFVNIVAKSEQIYLTLSNLIHVKIVRLTSFLFLTLVTLLFELKLNTCMTMVERFWAVCIVKPLRFASIYDQVTE